MSDNEIREAICLLLKAAPVRAMSSPAAAPETFVKAGILPFLPAPATENWRFLLMQPVAMHPHLGTPTFQLAKGTRMQKIGGEWHDIRGAFTGQPEALVETALREGNEELGLDLAGILRLFDAGPVGFTSVKTGVEKRMWLFAAEMRSEDCLLPASHELARTTARRAWFSLAGVGGEARLDHAAIIRGTAERLSALI